MKVTRIYFIFVLALTAALTACGGDTPGAAPPPAAEGQPLIGGSTDTPEPPPAARTLEDFAGDVEAPPFPPGLEWLNVAEPLTLEDLRGKVVLLDFWTYGCINCIHMLPVLAELEQKYADELVIISVHSAKFDAEGQTENLQQIVARYGIEHPVVNDDGFEVWQMYRVSAWPTYAVINPRGELYARDAGEIPLELFDRVIGEMVAAFDAAGEIDRREVAALAARDAGPGTALRFPGKVLADEAGGRLFIADSNHHRIVVAALDGYEVLAVIGTGRPGLADGSYDAAAFRQPQGMALAGDTLYVADTGNHAIRAVDLAAETVSTIAGTGTRGTGVVPFDAVLADPRAADLRSPWDVAAAGDQLYIAMAGTHQLWVMDLTAGTLGPRVGSGREGLLDGALAAGEMAQPSGLHLAGDMLYVADSESSSIRAVDLASEALSTLAGPRENTLFEFGDVDGPAGESRLQHPLGVTGGPDGAVYVADTYNSRIKRLNPAAGVIETVFGLGGSGGFADGGAESAAFDEPGGLDYAAGRLYVADTNNHAVRVIDLGAGQVSTVLFPNPEALRLEEGVLIAGGGAVQDAVSGAAQAAAPGDGVIRVLIDLPEGFKINDLVDSTVTLSVSGDAVSLAEENARQIVTQPELEVPVQLSVGSAVLTADFTLYYCRTGEEELCFIDTPVLEVPVSIEAGAGSSELLLTHEIVPPEALGGPGF